MILPIYLYGSQVLRDVAVEVDVEKEEGLRQFIDDMYETMRHADGCGIAAPQVGRSIRVLIVDGDDFADKYPYLKGFHRIMINPVFTFKSEETIEYTEGCLSIPNVDAEIVRPKVIRVHYLDENYKEVEEEFDLFAARMVQHEMDHLDGVVFTDHAAPIRKKMIAGKLNGISRGCVRTSYRVKTDKK
ncbi:MAG: peptide deformylase [Bacteroidales bacterium]|nr:peptide deformylase [Bacteroidales bacterium]MDD4669791.1 peptide deformylase [Bacteroidales bacterium]